MQLNVSATVKAMPDPNEPLDDVIAELQRVITLAVMDLGLLVELRISADAGGDALPAPLTDEQAAGIKDVLEEAMGFSKGAYL